MATPSIEMQNENPNSKSALLLYHHQACRRSRITYSPLLPNHSNPTHSNNTAAPTKPISPAPARAAGAAAALLTDEVAAALVLLGWALVLLGAVVVARVVEAELETELEADEDAEEVEEATLEVALEEAEEEAEEAEEEAEAEVLEAWLVVEAAALLLAEAVTELAMEKRGV